MVLVGRYLSPFTRRVAVTLGLLGIPFESRPITAWQHLDEVRKVNPVGRVPALVLDDGDVLVDSAAILDYLDERVGPERALIPANGMERRLVLRLTVIALGVMEKGAAMRLERVMRPEDKIHRPWIEHNWSQAVSGLEWLNRQITGPWLTGERLTQADVTTVVACDFLRLVDEALFPNGAYSALQRLVEQAAAIPAFARTHPANQ